MVTWKHSGWVAVRYNWWKKWGAVAVMWREQPRYDLNNSPHNGSSQHGNPCPWTPLEQSPLYPKIKHAKCKHMENNEQIRVGEKNYTYSSQGSALTSGSRTKCSENLRTPPHLWLIQNSVPFATFQGEKCDTKQASIQIMRRKSTKRCLEAEHVASQTQKLPID